MGIKELLTSMLPGFLKKEIPALPTEVKESSGFGSGFYIKPIKTPEEPTLKECIEEFIAQYLIQERVNPNSTSKAYKAFRRMFCSEEEDIGKNEKKQNDLHKIVRRNNDSLGSQISNDRLTFMHISGRNGLSEKTSPEMEKLYINCDRRNIAALAKEIYMRIRGIAGEELQMKFLSEQIYKSLNQADETNKPIKNYQRNDRIVIYAKDHRKTEMFAEEIKELRREKPELFSTTKSLPLLPKKHGFIGIARGDSLFCAKTPFGILSAQTYNKLLANVMFESVVAAFDMEKFGYVLINGSEETTPIDERMRTYVENFDKMSQKQRDDVVNCGAELFVDFCRDNNISTVYTPDIPITPAKTSPEYFQK